MKIGEIFKITWLPVLIASLCCLAPVIFVLLGLSTVAFAASLTDVLYGEYSWLFQIAGLLALALTILIYLRKQKNVCTLDQAKRKKRQIINIILIALAVGVVGYIV
ncbi:unnamed protein product [marine sediment metagenome]|uniref:Mercuric transport protein MerT n=1 Tax=marine sediment metagenome TaxID=412755 RepID=X1AA99_9ZZZZ